MEEQNVEVRYIHLSDNVESFVVKIENKTILYINANKEGEMIK